ncbi:MAG TPA: hypothetical protein DDW98_09390 [Gammaproteobacteria bacterium]|nr:hypothetical protein [Gammaproteobacteria bacterium]
MNLRARRDRICSWWIESRAVVTRSRIQTATALLLLVAGSLATVPPGAAQSASSDRPLWHSLQPGPHAIGFRLLNVEDPTRPGNPHRLVRLAIWYPAPAGQSATDMRFADYLEVAPDVSQDPGFESWMNAQDRESLSRQFFNPDSTVQQAALMSAPVPVYVAADPADGRFPLVLHSLGRNGNQYQHTILWEYLASHGFVVVSVAQFGRSLQDPWMDFNVRDLTIQLDDMRVALDALAELSFVDATRSAALGHSSGAIVALWLSTRDARVRAVVGLDGSVNRRENHREFRRGLDGRRVSAAFLNICRWPHDEYDERFAEHLLGPITRIGIEKAIHFDFQNWPAYQAFAGGTEPSSMAVRSVDSARIVFETTAIVTRLFLESHLQSDGQAQATLESEDAVADLSQGQATVTVQRR